MVVNGVEQVKWFSLLYLFTLITIHNIFVYFFKIKMPIIIVSGYPCSGKTTRVKELKEYFLNKGKKVEIISENIATSKAGFHKNELFADSQKEKIIRSDLKSESNRILNKDDVVILDAGNYIKGLFNCISYQSLNLWSENSF